MREVNRSLARYALDQLDGVDGVRARPMMGGYIFYLRDRIFGGVYGDGLFAVKITEASRRAMPDSEPQPPYPGAGDMLPVTILDDRERFRAMVEAMYGELPERKPRKPAKRE